ncbi:MAG: cobalamin-binding protein [Chloroflexi bacterium]|nr:cobalamin-binding protein [Chloroflexota bacterium]
MRIASLVPAGTEIACALGLGDQLVAVTHDCNYPAAVRSLPRLTSSTIPEGTTSFEIDQMVRSAGERGESTFHVDAGALRAARPDVILGQTICRVCAVTLDQLPAEIGSTPRTIPLNGETMDGVFADIQRAADGLGVSARGERVVSALRARSGAIGALVAGRARPRVACIEWLDPIFPGGHWVPQQVEIAGGIDVLWKVGRPSAAIAWDEVREARPEVVVLMPCGWDTRRALDEAPAVTMRPGFFALPAARSGRVFATNGSAYFSRPGPRLVDGVEILAALLHPGVFPPPRAEDAVPISLGVRMPR